MIQPKAVLLLENSQLAREVYTDEVSDKIGHWSPAGWKRDLVGDKVERYLSRQKNLMAISELCQENKTELKIISAAERHEIGMNVVQGNENEKFVCFTRFDASKPTFSTSNNAEMVRGNINGKARIYGYPD